MDPVRFQQFTGDAICASLQATVQAQLEAQAALNAQAQADPQAATQAANAQTKDIGQDTNTKACSGRTFGRVT